MKTGDKSFSNYQLASELDRVADRIARYLADEFKVNQGFACREFYGSAFSLWLWSWWPNQYGEEINNSSEYIHNHKKNDGPDGKYHWEFVRLAVEAAFANMGQINRFNSPAELLGREKFVGTRVANWILLRSTVRLMGGGAVERVVAHLERWWALLWFQRKGGLIEDERGRPTLQYHAFSVAMIAFQVSEFGVSDRLTMKRLKRSLDILARLTLRGGQCNYLGRGQLQSFGYSAAILAFVLGSTIFKEPEYLVYVRQVFDFLARYQREDGSIPLVLREEEDVKKELVDTTCAKFLGWYSCNNYFDYLSFTGALLKASSAHLSAHLDDFQEFKLVQHEKKVDDALIDDIRIFKNDLYTAILRPPSDRWASSLPLPYVEIAGQYPLPCYGGEQLLSSLYSSSGLPLPVLSNPRGDIVSLASDISFKWSGDNEFYGYNRYISFRRRFIFSSKKIIVKDMIKIKHGYEGWQLHNPRFLVPIKKHRIISHFEVNVGQIIIHSNMKLEKEPNEYFCATGPLSAYSSSIKLTEFKLQKMLKSYLHINVYKEDHD